MSENSQQEQSTNQEATPGQEALSQANQLLEALIDKKFQSEE